MFWDSSALIPLLFPESRSAALVATYNGDPDLAVWWGAPVECQSAIYRRSRDATFPKPLMAEALGRLRAIIDGADVVLATEDVRQRAGRLLALHSLRAGDALQLAAALAWCEEQPADEVFVCLDARLREAAAREGFGLRPE